MGTVVSLADLSPLGRLMRQWRVARGLSQLELALRAGVSARHLSFVETGRAQPGRELVLRLTSALDLPLRDRNAALNAAGYAPIYRQGNLRAPEMAPVVQALDFILRQQEPYPAMVIDRTCDVLKWNRAAERFLRVFVGASCSAPAAQGPLADVGAHADCAHPMNLARLLLEPDWLRPYIANWSEVARLVLSRLRRDLGAEPPGTEGALQLEHLLAQPGLPDGGKAPAPEVAAPPIVPSEFRKDGRVFKLFTTLACFGTPQDVTLQELVIECSFPVDEGTDALLRELAGL